MRCASTNQTSRYEEVHVPRSRWSQLAPLTGLIAVLLIVIGFAVGGDTPDIKASAAKIRSTYDDEQAKQFIQVWLIVVAAFALVFYGAALRSVLRPVEALRSRWSDAVLGGAVIAASGFILAALVHGATVEAADKKSVEGPALQALNALDNWTWPPLIIGLGVMMLAAGLLVLRGAPALPRWMGWLGVLIGILPLTLYGGFVALPLGGIWLLISSIMLTRNWATHGGDAGTDGSAAAARTPA